MGIPKSDALDQQQQVEEHTPLLLLVASPPTHAIAVNGDASANKRLVPVVNDELDAEHLASYVA